MFQEYKLRLFVTKEQRNMDYFFFKAILLVNSLVSDAPVQQIKFFYTQRNGFEKGRS